VEAGIALSSLEEINVLMASYVDNTSQSKDWIFDLGSTVHVCSQKELFNSLVTKEEGTVKMVDGSACEVIGTGTVKVTERDGMVHALEAVQYVPEARYNLISIRVLDEEGCRIQVQQGIVTVEIHLDEGWIGVLAHLIINDAELKTQLQRIMCNQEWAWIPREGLWNYSSRFL